MKTTALTLMLVSLICAGCATTGDTTDENEPTLSDAALRPRWQRRSKKRLPPRTKARSKKKARFPDPNFERGATNLLNAMKAAVCLLDLELAAMRADIRLAYPANPTVLGIFPVAAYNGGPRNVTKLYRVLARMKVDLDELSRPGVQPAGSSVTCPCVWKAEGTNVRPVAIPKYNNENRWYIEKYQSIVSLFE